MSAGDVEGVKGGEESKGGKEKEGGEEKRTHSNSNDNRLCLEEHGHTLDPKFQNIKKKKKGKKKLYFTYGDRGPKSWVVCLRGPNCAGSKSRQVASWSLLWLPHQMLHRHHATFFLSCIVQLYLEHFDHCCPCLTSLARAPFPRTDWGGVLLDGCGGEETPSLPLHSSRERGVTKPPGFCA